ncbi:MAG: hypothetical protein R3E12_14255 [Candidatus Eisenbacteria bacterium]|uniref:Uncharacterized protein n=1 Tax=Eiseniibacteriota bacterium TaxID=2212470 RepID=A0A956LXR9_UNCEI|nr:hypothetical protein [Candidatus Eisenbacteria bacterium]
MRSTSHPNPARTFTITALACLIAISASAPRPAQGGVNEGGVLLVTTDPTLEFSAGTTYCDAFTLSRCEDGITNLPAPDVARVWWVSLAFPVTSNPRVKGTNFGVQYDADHLALFDYRACGDFEIPYEGWPASGTGTAVTWTTTQAATLVPVYWFAGYADASTSFDMGVHPTQGGVIADDSVPAQVDPIAAFGSLGFGTDPGSLPCPTGEPTGSCCLDPCECILTIETDCLDQGGIWQAGGDCSLDVCGCPPSACCFGDGTCIVTTEADCQSEGGEYLPGVACDPDPCPIVTGACCLPDGTCEELTSADCTARDGFWAGAETACESTECQEPCDPIPSRRWSTESTGMGPNAGGMLILHHNPDIEYSFGETNYCGQSDLDHCREAQPRSDSDESLLFVLAAFPESASPRMTGVGFGIEYSSCVAVLQTQYCGDLVAPETNWPESGSGTLTFWNQAQTGFLTEVYTIATYIEPGYSGQLALVPHPRSGARYFLDDALPAHTDPIADYGIMGLRTDGYAPCPDPSISGACCFEDGACVELEESECVAEGGAWQGPVPCEPNPCSPVPTLDKSWGAIKKLFRE